LNYLNNSTAINGVKSKKGDGMGFHHIFKLIECSYARMIMGEEAVSGEEKVKEEVFVPS